MKFNNYKVRLRNALALLCAVSILSVDLLSVSATNTIDKLEQETSALENELDALQDNLTSLSAEITKLASRIKSTNESIQKTELDLAAAKLNEEIQYDAMKKRIKFLYETGNPSFIDMICNSQSMGEFLNKSEFIKTITEYDRDLLYELEASRKEIAMKEASLKEDQAELQKLQAELSSQKKALDAAISSASGRLAESSAALEAAKKAQASTNGSTGSGSSGSSSSGTGSSGSGSSNSGSSNSGSNSSVSTNDLVLLAALLQCEAGTSNYDALLAVATVVMNRVASSRFPNTINGVIYQKGQFSPTWNGSLKKVLSKGPSSLCYTAARDALAGKRLAKVQNCLFFNATWATNRNGVVVGGNVFW